MKLVHKLSTASLAAATYLTLAVPAFAQGTQVDICPPDDQFFKLCRNLNADKAGSLVGFVVNVLFTIAVVIALIFLIWGGIKWILSGGDKGKVEAARGTIIAAIVGLIITFAAYFILNIILSIFGLTINNLDIPRIEGL